MNILHISHTDIKSDSRILKEMNALASASGNNLFGIGFYEDNKRKSTYEGEMEIHSIPLSAKSLPRQLSLIRHLLIYIEFFFKSL